MRVRLHIIFAVCLITVACGIGWKHVRERNRRLDAKAEQYYQQAVRETSASTTARDARAWLARNGFEVALYSHNEAVTSMRSTSEGVKSFATVLGYRLLAPSSGVYAERWVMLKFLFRPLHQPDVPGEFVGVEVYYNRTPSKAFQSEFARRSSATSPATATSMPRR